VEIPVEDVQVGATVDLVVTGDDLRGGELEGGIVSQLVPFGHVFGLLLPPFRSKFTQYSKSLCKKTTKTSNK
jgi:hypothetical protein